MFSCVRGDQSKQKSVILGDCFTYERRLFVGRTLNRLIGVTEWAYLLNIVTQLTLATNFSIIKLIINHDFFFNRKEKNYGLWSNF